MVMLPLYIAVAFVSLVLCLLIVRLPVRFLNSEHMRQDLSARQSQHNRPTPRIGGVAIFCAFAVGLVLMSGRLGNDLILSFGAGFFVFLIGLKEDLRRDVSPRTRLAVAFIAAGIAALLSGSWVPGLGLGSADAIFGWSVLAVAVTLLWSAGSCHALNLIDGLNGLAAGYTICAACGFWIIAGYTGDADIQLAAGLLIAAVLGFLVFNWPLGTIFMGDAGAYTIGHVLGWMGLLLIVRNPDLAGVALLLVMFWPIAETTYSMIRRRLGRKATGLPDKMHFHHLVVRAIALLFNGGQKRPSDNSLASLVIAPLYVVPIVFGVLLWDQGWQALQMVLLFTILFIVTYVASMRFFSSARFRRSSVLRTRQVSQKPSYVVPPAE